MVEKTTVSGVQGKWSDREIFDTGQDRFGSQDYANVLADRAATADTPLAIGIFGRWGSGKTSLMRLVAESLSERAVPIENIWINVWQLSNREELWNAFLQALFSQVHKGLPRRRRWAFDWSLFRERVQWGELLRALLVNSYRIVVAVTPILLTILWPDDAVKDAGGLMAFALDPLTGGAASLILGLWLLLAPAIEAAKEKVSIDFDVILKESPYEIQVSELQRLQKQFERLVKTWVGEQGRLVVFIDDLDRCTPDKIPEVLEAIKLFTNTPRCVYIIGLDHEIVTQGIAIKYKFQENEADDYLEKIIQIPFHLPPLDDNRIMRFVVDDYADVHQICATAPDVFAQGLEPNPRKVKRALNIYRTLWELAEVRVNAWEMDPVDPELLAKMVVIQSRFGALNEYFRENPAALTLVEQCAVFDEFEAELVKGDLELAENMRKNTEKIRPTLNELVPAETRSALNRLFTSGEKQFRKIHPGNLATYIYLTGTAEGLSDLMRPSRQEREALLSNHPERVRQQVEMILARAADEDERERLTQSYRKRLQIVRQGQAGYQDAEVDSAGFALAWFEMDGLTATTRAQVFRERFATSQADVETKAQQLAKAVVDGLTYQELPGIRGYLRGLWQALEDGDRPRDLQQAQENADSSVVRNTPYVNPTKADKQALIDLLLAQRFPLLPQIIRVPAGLFVMGSENDPNAREEEKPQHIVKLSEYWIGKYPITNQQYQAFIQSRGYAAPENWRGDQYPHGKGQHPVTDISWPDAVAYCEWLSQRLGKHFRLPSEAEWEKAARRTPTPPPPNSTNLGEAAEGRRGARVYPWGDAWEASKCNTKESRIGDTTPVGQFSPQSDSPTGCADMAGNVLEWCADWFDEREYWRRDDEILDPPGPEHGEYRVLRGGSWNYDLYLARCAARGFSLPNASRNYIGFRIARSGE